MAAILKVGWFPSPTGCWHHGTVYAAVKGIRTDCGIRADRQTWWLDSFDSRRVPPEGEHVCLRCERRWQEEGGSGLT